MQSFVVGLAALSRVIIQEPNATATEQCRDFAYETFTLGHPTVYADDQWIEAPNPVAALTQLQNSRDSGFGVVIQEPAAARGAVFRIDGTFPPTSAVDAMITSSSRKKTRSCGTPIPFRPLRPGHYVFVQPLDDGSFVGAELLVAPGRDFVELRMRDAGRRIRAVFPVTCARFEDDVGAACSRTDVSPKDLDTIPQGAPGTPSTVSPHLAYQRRLGIQTRVSWTLAGLGVGGIVVGGLLSPRDCCHDGIGYLVVLPIAAALTVSATIAGAVYTHRLRDHRKYARRTAHVEPLLTGVGFRF